MSEQLTFEDVDIDAFGRLADTTQRGWRAPAVCTIVGITYRQLDYWARTGLAEPSIATSSGSGSVRLYSFADLLVLRIVKRLLDAGISLANIRTAVAALEGRGITDLTGLTLVSDGISIFECTTAGDIVDLLAGGQGVFGIAIGASLPELRENIRALPPETVTGIADPAPVLDELAQRRTRDAS